MKIAETIEFSGDDGLWAMHVEGSVGAENDVEHVWVSVRQDERPVSLIDLDPANARRIAALLTRVADAVEAHSRAD